MQDITQKLRDFSVALDEPTFQRAAEEIAKLREEVIRLRRGIENRDAVRGAAESYYEWARR